MSPSEPTREFVDAVHQALQLWHKEPELGSPLANLALVQQRQAVGANSRRATNDALAAGLAALAADRERDAALLRDRFIEEKTVFVVAHQLGIAEATLYRQQRQAIVQLAQVLLLLEGQALAERQRAWTERLPLATYERLLGVEAHLEHLGAILLTPDAPWVVAIEGLGGLGKTALAHQLATRLAQHPGGFADFAWVSVRQQTLPLGGPEFEERTGAPALTVPVLIEALAGQLLRSSGPAPVAADRALAALDTRLHQAPHLIVIDNLETLSDVASLAPTLARLAGPSKFLLTSRETLQGATLIYHYPVPELAETDALNLVRAEARLRNLSHVTEASNSDLRPIFETVGGNPLALRLVTGQLHLLTLGQVIDNLREARGKRAEELYRFIYWDAWRRLPADAQETLLLMPLFAGDGADITALQRVSDLAGASLMEALDTLVTLCLVTVSGDLHKRRYSIHRLTESFLLKEVIKWQGTPPPV